MAAEVRQAIEREQLESLTAGLRRWLAEAKAAGLDGEAVLALVTAALEPGAENQAARP